MHPAAAKRKADDLPSNQLTLSSFFRKAAAAAASAQPKKLLSPSIASPPVVAVPSPVKSVDAPKPPIPPTVAKPVPAAALQPAADEPSGALGAAEGADALSSDLGDVSMPQRAASNVAADTKEKDADRDWTEEEESALRKHYAEYAGLDACYAIIASLIPNRSAHRIVHKLFDLDLITYKQLRSASLVTEEEEKEPRDAPAEKDGAILTDKAKQLLSSASVRRAVPWICTHLRNARSVLGSTDAYLLEPKTADDFSFLGDSEVQSLLDELPFTTVTKGALSYWAIAASLPASALTQLASELKKAEKKPFSVVSSSPSSSRSSSFLLSTPTKNSSTPTLLSPSPAKSRATPPAASPARYASASPTKIQRTSVGQYSASSPIKRDTTRPASPPPSPPLSEEIMRARKAAAALDDFKLEEEIAVDE